jgi:hypothetical protein
MNLFPLGLALAIVAGPCCAHAVADGGQVRVSERHGDYQLTVFTSPNPLRAGPVDISVLVQHADTEAAITDASVTVELTAADRASPPIRAAATTAAATNKLLTAALVDLPAAGRWDVRLTITPPRASTFATAFTMNAAPPLPAWLTVWPWFSWPILVVIVFAVHRGLVARRIAQRPSQHFRMWGTA